MQFHKLQLALPKGGVDTGVFDVAIQALIQSKSIEWLNMYIQYQFHFIYYIYYIKYIYVGCFLFDR